MIAPFRIGTTSFIYPDARPSTRPDDLLAADPRAGGGSWLGNVERLAGRVDDVEILVFESGGGPGTAEIEPVIDELGLSVALDLGHLDRDGRAERALLERQLHRTRAIPWHGVDPAGRDHRSLVHYPAAKARWVIDLLRERYRGVVTLEVFREADFEESIALIHALIAGREPVRAARNPG
jgi:hypothetical protein